MRVLTAIVTHNRRALLERCLDAIEQQTRPTDGTVVINNASTDGTVEMLERRRVEYVTQANVGSAGGWHRAIEHAAKHGFDAVWLMDDDGFPDPRALAALVPKLKEDVACVSSVVLREEDRNRFVFPFPLLNDQLLPTLSRFPRKIKTLDKLRLVSRSETYPFAHLFNGALVSLRAVREVGNINREYFIFGDDVDYFFRMRRWGAVLSVFDAMHFHPSVEDRPLTDQKVYYYLRNSLVLHKKYFDHASLRNILSIVIAVVRVLRRNGLVAAISFVIGSRLGILVRAVQQGNAGKLGSDFSA